jgi:hypothetical protein
VSNTVLAFLSVLTILSALLCVAFALSDERLNPAHPFEVDPLDAADHRGRHAAADVPTEVIRDGLRVPSWV